MYRRGFYQARFFQGITHIYYLPFAMLLTDVLTHHSCKNKERYSKGLRTIVCYLQKPQGRRRGRLYVVFGSCHCCLATDLGSCCYQDHRGESPKCCVFIMADLGVPGIVPNFAQREHLLLDTV